MPQTKLNSHHLATSNGGIDPSSGIVPVDLLGVLRMAGGILLPPNGAVLGNGPITIRYFDAFASAFNIPQGKADTP